MALARSASSATFNQVISLQPGAITAGSASVQDFTVKGLNPDSGVVVNPLALNAGLILSWSNVPSNDKLRMAFWNPTGGDITPASQKFIIYQP